MSFVDIKKAVLEMDDESLSAQNLKGIKDSVPTLEEVRQFIQSPAPLHLSTDAAIQGFRRFDDLLQRGSVCQGGNQGAQWPDRQLNFARL